MHERKNKANSESLTQGQKIGGSICKSSIIISDLAIVWMMDGSCKVFKKESVSKKAELYKIDDAEITEVFIPRNHEIMILKTKNKTYVRDFNNQIIDEAKHWKITSLNRLRKVFIEKMSEGIGMISKAFD